MLHRRILLGGSKSGNSQLLKEYIINLTRIAEMETNTENFPQEKCKWIGESLCVDLAVYGEETQEVQILEANDENYVGNGSTVETTHKINLNGEIDDETPCEITFTLKPDILYDIQAFVPCTKVSSNDDYYIVEPPKNKTDFKRTLNLSTKWGNVKNYGIKIIGSQRLFPSHMEFVLNKNTYNEYILKIKEDGFYDNYGSNTFGIALSYSYVVDGIAKTGTLVLHKTGSEYLSGINISSLLPEISLLFINDGNKWKIEYLDKVGFEYNDEDGQIITGTDDRFDFSFDIMSLQCIDGVGNPDNPSYYY